MLTIILVTLLSISSALQCVDYLDSPLIPMNLAINNTCSGRFCYRVEKNMKYLQPAGSIRTAAIMGCFEYPLEILKLGCRRNIDGLVLCVCQTDRCNAIASANVTDLPIVPNCRLQDTTDDDPDDGDTCTANYCLMHRGFFFDVYANIDGNALPAGICITFHGARFTDEFCSCSQRDNCTTPSLYPRNSALPLDTRDEGMIDCASKSELLGIRKCRGHACFVEHNPVIAEDFFGCIRYDERFKDKRFRLGITQFPGKAFYICNKSMCNLPAKSEGVFSGMQSKPPADRCNCSTPSGDIVQAKNVATINISTLLSICIPILVLLLIVALIWGFRVFTKKWPPPLTYFYANACEIGRTRRANVINVVSKADEMKKL